MNRNELAKLLEIEGIPSSMYSLDGNLFTPDRIVLYKNYSLWEVFYLDDRGDRYTIKMCTSEDEACTCIHQELVLTGILSVKSIFFSHNPECFPNTMALIKEKGILETVIRIWMDSIIKDSTLPKDINAVIFFLEKDKDWHRYSISFLGSKSINTTEDIVNFSVDYVPYHDKVHIGFENVYSDPDKEFSDIISRVKNDKDNTAYTDFFEGKSIYVGFKDNLHIVQ